MAKKRKHPWPRFIARSVGFTNLSLSLSFDTYEDREAFARWMEKKMGKFAPREDYLGSAHGSVAKEITE